MTIKLDGLPAWESLQLYLDFQGAVNKYRWRGRPPRTVLLMINGPIGESGTVVTCVDRATPVNFGCTLYEVYREMDFTRIDTLEKMYGSQNN